jgi:hypothetical protein
LDVESAYKVKPGDSDSCFINVRHNLWPLPCSLWVKDGQQERITLEMWAIWGWNTFS